MDKSHRRRKDARTSASSIAQQESRAPQAAFGFRSANVGAGESVVVSNVKIQAVPKPGTLALAGIALAGLAGLRRRRRASSMI